MPVLGRFKKALSITAPLAFSPFSWLCLDSLWLQCLDRLRLCRFIHYNNIEMCDSSFMIFSSAWSGFKVFSHPKHDLSHVSYFKPMAQSLVALTGKKVPKTKFPRLKISITFKFQVWWVLVPVRGCPRGSFSSRDLRLTWLWSRDRKWCSNVKWGNWRGQSSGQEMDSPWVSKFKTTRLQFEVTLFFVIQKNSWMTSYYVSSSYIKYTPL